MISLSTVVKMRAATSELGRFGLYKGNWFENVIAKIVCEGAEPVFNEGAILTFV